MRIIALGLVVLACGFGACAQNEGTPFVPANLSAAGGGSDAAGSGGRAEAGRAGSAAGRGGAGSGGSSGSDRRLPRECQFWPATNVRAEEELLTAIDDLRAGPSQTCGRTLPVQPLETDVALQCTARLRFSQSVPSRGGPPIRVTASPPDEDVSQRARRAGVPGSIIYEFVVDPASSAEDVLHALEDSPNRTEFCGYITQGFFTEIGVAFQGNVWAIELGHPTQNSPAHSGPMPGDH